MEPLSARALLRLFIRWLVQAHVLNTDVHYAVSPRTSVWHVEEGQTMSGLLTEQWLTGSQARHVVCC